MVSEIDRQEREERANLDALEEMIRRMPAGQVRALVSLPQIREKLIELEAENKETPEDD